MLLLGMVMGELLVVSIECVLGLGWVLFLVS